MMPLNKEKAAFAIVLVIAVYGFATAFQEQAVSHEVPDELPEPTDGPPPPMKLVKAGFLENSFDYYWGGDEESNFRNPWVIAEETRRLSHIEWPLEMPPLAEMGKVVPTPPNAPRQDSWPVMRQNKPPVSVEQTEPDAEEDGG
jgi:hypothetical protein